MASPKRKEEGIAPGTVAVMQTAGTKAKPHEIWVMYQVANSKWQMANGKKAKSNFEIAQSRLRPLKKKVITAWRYPGVSKPRAPLPIPDEILQELDELV